MKSLFQPIVLTLLAACCALTAYWIASDSGVYAWIGGYVGTRIDNLSIFLTLYLTFWVPFGGWIVLALLLRRITGQPSLELGWHKLRQAYHTEHARNEKLYATPPNAYTPAMRRRARYFGIVFIILGGTFLTAVGISLIVSLQAQRIYSMQIMLAVLGLFFIGGGFYQLITGRTVVRRRARTETPTE